MKFSWKRGPYEVVHLNVKRLNQPHFLGHSVGHGRFFGLRGFFLFFLVIRPSSGRRCGRLQPTFARRPGRCMLALLATPPLPLFKVQVWQFLQRWSDSRTRCPAVQAVRIYLPVRYIGRHCRHRNSAVKPTTQFETPVLTQTHTTLGERLPVTEEHFGAGQVGGRRRRTIEAGARQWRSSACAGAGVSFRAVTPSPPAPPPLFPKSVSFGDMGFLKGATPQT